MLILVRHGRTTANSRGELQGRADNELDEFGRTQAARLAAAVGPVDHVISSPLARARQTADAFGVGYEIDERWIEYDYGALEGTPLSQVPREIWSRWQTDSTWEPPGGESYDALFARVIEACDELAARAATEQIVVVSHVSPIKAAIGWVLGLPATAGTRYHLDVASISRISVGQFGPVLRSYNETWHLS